KDGEKFFNNGDTPPSVDNGAKKPFENTTTGTNKQEICTGDQKHARWAKMVQEPIIPPTTAGGLDTSGGDDWHVMTIDEAEQINCQSDSQGDQFGTGGSTLVNSWGDNQEVWFTYYVGTRKLWFMTLWPGYRGTAKFHSLDGMHNYEIGVQTQV